MLQYPVSWSAPHIRGDGKKNWVDVATAGVEEDGEMMKRIKIEDISKPSEKLSELRKEDFKPLPAAFRHAGVHARLRAAEREGAEEFEASLDDTIAVSHSQAQEQGGRGRAGRQVPLRPGKALHQGEQLDVSAAAAAFDGPLRDVPHLLRRLPHLRGQRQEPDLSAGLSLRGLPPALQEVRQGRTAACCRPGEPVKSSSTGRRSPAWPSSPIAATSAGAAHRPARSASTTA